MKKFNTDMLMENLISEENFSEFLVENQEQFIDINMSEYILFLIKDKSINVNNIIKKSNIESSYFYQILKGRRIPRRKKIIQLAIGMELNINESQMLLRLGDRCLLYPRVKKDAAIIYCINNKFSLIETYRFLNELGLSF